MTLFHVLASLALILPTASDDPWRWPLPTREVIHAFAEPEHQYGPGHRGIDIVTRVATPVTAVADGVVAHAGPVAGVGTVSIDHGAIRSTYQPLSPAVSAGDEVQAGDVIGHVTRRGSHCMILTCLHLGARVGDDYIDPQLLLSAQSTVRLVNPDEPLPEPTIPHRGTGIPVAGPITSPYGWRVHPILGTRRFHNGVDYGAPCGAPVSATDAGRVVRAGWVGGYGQRIEIDHGSGHITSYSHLSGFTVEPSERVQRGDVIGYVGTTGMSTGCHLHYSVHINGETVPPL